MRIPARGEHFKDSFIQLEDGNVERSSPKVIDRDRALISLIQAVSERGRGRFIDNAENIQPCDAACVLCGLPLSIVEVGRHGNYGVLDFFA